jgi:hypothetical protein
MTEDRRAPLDVLAAFSQAISVWAHNGDYRLLASWLGRELDEKGAPLRLSLSQWNHVLNVLLAVGRYQPAWPAACRESISRMIQASLRFTRPDGSFATCFEGARPDAGGDGHSPPAFGDRRTLDFDASASSRLRARKRCLAEGMCDGLPLADVGWTSPRRALAGLNDDGAAMRDFLVVDHQSGQDACRFELFGAGRSWLGPAWSLDGDHRVGQRPRPGNWVSTVTADLAEWCHATDDDRVTRAVLLLRGRRLALLSVLVERKKGAPGLFQTRIALPPPVTASSIEGCRAVLLSQPSSRATAQVVPIGLPAPAYTTDRGRFSAEGGELLLAHASAGRRTWLPLVVSWDGARHRKRLHWRVLTVSERSRKVGPDRAVAIRVSWGREETYVIYRSLTAPGPRVFLGHRSLDRFLVGRFTPEGTIEPIFTVE